MRILGIHVHIQIRESAFLEKQVKLFSTQLNKASDQTKKNVVIVLILMAVGIFSGLLITGLTTSSITVLEVPEWESPLILHDSLFNNSQNKQAYETDN